MTSSEPLTLYLRLADELLAQIRRGVFIPGQRLPSVRALSIAKGLSATTVQEAYRRLEDTRWIVIKAKSGAYVAACLPNAEPLPIAARVDYLNELLPLGAAVPDDYLFPCKRLAANISALLRQDPEILGRYNFAPGSLELRQQIARRVSDWNARVDPARVVITNGAVEAVQLCLRAVTRPGDTVAVEHPAYYGFLQIIQNLGLTALPIDNSGSEGMDLDALEHSLQSRPVAALLLSTTVSNPSGCSMPLANKQRLVDIAQRHNLPVIEDATFADLHFEGRCQAAQGFDQSGLFMLCASLTKTVAPGMRIGWVDAGRFSEQVGYLKRISSVGQPRVMELALAQYMASGGMAKHLRHIREVMQNRVKRVAEQVSAAFATDASFELPSGGFLLWVKLPRAIDSLAFQEQSLAAGVGISPGAWFSPSGNYRNYIRLNCGVADDDKCAAGILALARITREQLAR